ncbi:hypothetical protein AB1K70_19310 [Bremerella sp. JC770]|uniref:hypothetical protein n=1 Tax=Bremerella sp. JC770 TaxID=3232137 RepID=UPI00345845C7
MNTPTLIVASLVLVGLVGCSQSEHNTAPVSGMVTYEGQPAAGARVLFIPVDGTTRAVGSEVNQEGKYELYFSTTQVGAKPGAYKVQITYSPGKSKERISPQFSRGEMEVNVSETDNVFDFELSNK